MTICVSQSVNQLDRVSRPAGRFHKMLLEDDGARLVFFLVFFFFLKKKECSE